MDIDKQVDNLLYGKKEPGNIPSVYKKHWRPVYNYFILCVVMLSLGIYALPFFQQKEEGFDAQEHLVEELNKNKSNLGDEPLNGSAYNYWSAPQNSMGIKSMVSVNFTFWRSWLKKYFSYELEARANNESQWQNANELLNVSLLFNETNNTCKVTLTLNTTNAPTSLYYRFTLVANRSVISHINKSVDYEYTLNLSANATENYSLVYNYSDLTPFIQSGVITIKQGIYNNYFYQRIKTNKKIAVNKTVVIDPNFGEEGTGAAGQGFIGDIWGIIRSPATNGTLGNMTAYLKFDGAADARCAIYNNATKALVEVTEERSVDTGNVFAWETFNFSGTQAINTSWNYYICVWSSVDDLRFTGTGGYYFREKTGYTGNFPDPVTNEASGTNTICIYASYTEGEEEGESWQQNFTGYWTGGNTSSWDQNFSGWWSGGNVSGASWQQNFTGYWTGGNDTVTWQSNYSGFWTGGNIANWSQNFTGYWLGGNVTNFTPEQMNMYPCSTNVSVQPTLSVQINDTEGDTMNQSFWSNYTDSWAALDYNNNTANASLQYSFVEATTMGITYWWSSNTTDGVNWINDSCSFTTDVIKTWQSNFSGYWLGGNISGLTQNYSGWWSGGNDTVTWDQNFTGYFTGGNATVTWQQNFTGYWTGGNDTVTWQSNYSGYWTGGNTTVGATWQQNFTGFWTGGNISRTYQQNFTGFWTGGNVSAVFEIVLEYPANESNIWITQPTVYFNFTHPNATQLMNYTLYVGNSTANLTLVYTGNNVSVGRQVNSNHVHYAATTFYHTHYWRVEANDGTSWVNETYNFQAVLQGSLVDSGAGFAVGVAMAAAMLGIGFVFIIRRRRREDEY